MIQTDVHIVIYLGLVSCRSSYVIFCYILYIYWFILLCLKIALKCPRIYFKNTCFSKIPNIEISCTYIVFKLGHTLNKLYIHFYCSMFLYRYINANHRLSSSHTYTLYYYCMLQWKINKQKICWLIFGNCFKWQNYKNYF